MRSDRVTCYPTQLNTPSLNCSQRPVVNLPTPEGWKAELTKVSSYIPRWFTCPQTVTHPSSNPAVHGRESNSRPVDHKSDVLTTAPPSHPPVTTRIGDYRLTGKPSWNVGNNLGEVSPPPSEVHKSSTGLSVWS